MRRVGRAIIEYARDYQQDPFHPHRLRFGPPRSSEVAVEETNDVDNTTSIDFDELERRLAQLRT